MEDNDVVLYASGRYHVVILEPTLVYLERPLRRWPRQRPEKVVEYYRINELMGRWIQYQGHAHSIPTAVWGFGDRAVFDAIIERIGRLYGRYVFRFEHFTTERDAVAALVADAAIATVYDADPGRVDRAWRMRGHRVLVGEAP